MTFTGWSMEAVDFYAELEANNSKVYWDTHRQVYDTQVYPPMLALLADLAPQFGAGKIFRPNRDIRFSADKSPYKTAIGAMLEHGGYVQLSAQGLAAGCGYYLMSPDQVDRYRQAVADDHTGPALVTLIQQIEKHGIDIGGRETLKSAPRGYPRDHPRIGLLRNKGLVAWRQWQPGPWLSQPQAAARVIEFLELTTPLADWLHAEVGPSQSPGRHAGKRPGKARQRAGGQDGR